MRMFALAIMAATLIVAGLQMWAEEGQARAQGAPAQTQTR
jgi:Defensin propeptide